MRTPTFATIIMIETEDNNRWCASRRMTQNDGARVREIMRTRAGRQDARSVCQ